MDRNFILENFHAISQIQDYEECIQILESVDWNLDFALTSIEQGNAFGTPETESIIGIPYESSLDQCGYTSIESRNLQFYVDIRGQTLSVIINEDKTVRELAELVALQINEPHSKFKINGPKIQYDSNAQLKSFNLPPENYVVANPVDSSSASSSTINLPVIKTFNFFIDVSFNGEHRENLELSFDGKDTVGKVKSIVATHLGSSILSWTGWPDHIWGDDISLRNCGISENASFTVNVLPEKKAAKPTSRLKAECNRTPTEASLNNSRADEFENDEENDYYEEDIGIIEQETEWTIKRSLALMNQDAHSDAMTAVLQFSYEFASRYCPNDNLSKPPFYIGSIEDAIGSTLNLLPNERKPLFLYLHHGESIQANIFCTQVLCYKDIILFFTQSDYMIWPWDITYSENKSQLLNWLIQNFLLQVVPPLRIMQKDQFPILVALGKFQGNVEILEILDGGKSKDEILIHLWNIKSVFLNKQKADILAWKEQELRKQVKKEQDKAYLESLSQDRLKEKERDDKKRKIEEDEKNKMLQKQKFEEERNNRIKKATSKVPVEPEDGTDVITIRLRLPPNVDAPSLNALTRRFLCSHTLTHLIAYIESMGFLRTECNLFMTYPRTNLTQIKDHNITLKSLGIPKRETLIIERV